ncbi:MAG: hypothetical protein ACRDA4_01055 [Filifactoraceae bacterium]
MDIIINQSLIFNFIIAFVALLFMVLISVQFTLNNILREMREIKLLKSRVEYEELNKDGRR